MVVPGDSAARVRALEHQMHLQFDLVYTYHDIDGVLPTQDELKLVKAGHQLHVSIIPRDFGVKDKNTIKWKAVAQGKYDPELKRQARGVAQLSKQVFLTFDHEPDQASKAARGTPADYIAAWRHVHDLYHNLGVNNVTWVWVMMGWKPAFSRAGQLWPGNKYVDWLSWEVYNHSGCFEGRVSPAKWTSFHAGVETTYKWLKHQGRRLGIDPNKPMMISEAGSALYPRDPQRTARWYAEIPKVLHRFPQIKAITLFDNRTGTCDYQFQKQQPALVAVQHAIHATRGR